MLLIYKWYFYEPELVYIMRHSVCWFMLIKIKNILVYLQHQKKQKKDKMGSLITFMLWWNTCSDIYDRKSPKLTVRAHFIDNNGHNDDDNNDNNNVVDRAV